MKILIIQLSALGDIIYTLFNVKRLFYSLDCEIDWLVKDKNILLENQKEIKNIFYDNKDIEDNYDYIIDFGTKSSTFLLRYKLNGIKIGFRTYKKFFISFINDYNIPYNSLISVVQNQNNLIEFLCTMEGLEIKNVNPKIDYNDNVINDIDNYTKNFKNIIIFNPNASKENKEMSIDNWIKIFEEYKNNSNYSYVLIGSQFGIKGIYLSYLVLKKYKYIKLLPKNLDNFYNVAYLISKSELVYTPDTSILHLAEFQKIKNIGYFNQYSNKLMKNWNIY